MFPSSSTPRYMPKRSKNMPIQKLVHGTSLAVQWLRLCAPNAGVEGSIPGPGTKILHAARCSQKKKKEKKKTTKKTLYMNVKSRFIHNSQKLKTTQMSIDNE